ncbi:CaiB/BaiF CoA transferase family protein [Cupriavidus oxalaticus]|uniref:CoA transferase n=1 Tax=Cupriavidus oxalaticus TaxID=96344 RepID=A0A5P3VSB8_9BURK|nr:CoA transferase [Cupriavidus oxalaticus]QEZ49007.1 CoA transferase [Cupriavidus oxalaticus]
MPVAAWSCLRDARILDVSQLLPGPHAALALSQLGADVIKVEQPGGDTVRSMGPNAFAQLNHGKRCISLDLKTEAGRNALLALARDADAVIEGFRPGVMDRLGLGYGALSAQNPRIVMCSISGFGQTGPYAADPGHDLNYLALAGYWAVPAQVDDVVARPRVRVSDYAAAAYASLSLAVAIMSARQSSQGQHLDVSIHDAILAWTAGAAWSAKCAGHAGTGTPGVMPDNDIFETADGRHLVLGIMENKFWLALRECLGRSYPELQSPQYQTRAQRQQRKQEVNAMLKGIFASQPLAAWQATFAGTDVPFSAVLNADEVFDDPHVQARHVIRPLDGGNTMATRFPVKFSGGLGDIPARVAALGQDNDAVLAGGGWPCRDAGA